MNTRTLRAPQVPTNPMSSAVGSSVNKTEARDAVFALRDAAVLEAKRLRALANAAAAAAARPSLPSDATSAPAPPPQPATAGEPTSSSSMPSVTAGALVANAAPADAPGGAPALPAAAARLQGGGAQRSARTSTEARASSDATGLTGPLPPPVDAARAAAASDPQGAQEAPQEAGAADAAAAPPPGAAAETAAAVPASSTSTAGTVIGAWHGDREPDAASDTACSALPATAATAPGGHGHALLPGPDARASDKGAPVVLLSASGKAPLPPGRAADPPLASGAAVEAAQGRGDSAPSPPAQPSRWCRHKRCHSATAAPAPAGTAPVGAPRRYSFTLGLLHRQSHQGGPGGAHGAADAGKTLLPGVADAAAGGVGAADGAGALSRDAALPSTGEDGMEPQRQQDKAAAEEEERQRLQTPTAVPAPPSFKPAKRVSGRCWMAEVRGPAAGRAAHAPCALLWRRGAALAARKRRSLLPSCSHSAPGCLTSPVTQRARIAKPTFCFLRC